MEVTKYQIGQLPSMLADRWEHLLSANQSIASPFLTPAFCTAVDSTRGGVCVLYIKDTNGAEGFLPFQYQLGRRFLGHAEKVGAHMSDHFGIVGNLTKLDYFSDLLVKTGISALRFDHGVPSLCPFQFSDQEFSTGLRFRTDSFNGFSERLMRENKEFIKGVLRGERRMAADCGEITFEWHASSADDLEHLIHEKRAQFRRTEVDDGLSSSWARNLLFALLKNGGTSSCRPVLSILRAGGRWVASNLALVCRNTLHFWFPVYDLSYRRYSPGHILFFKVIEEACQQGLNVFDFGEGVSAYKVEYRGEPYTLIKGWVGAKNLSAQLERYLQSMIWKAHAIGSRRKR